MNWKLNDLSLSRISDKAREIKVEIKYFFSWGIALHLTENIQVNNW